MSATVPAQHRGEADAGTPSELPARKEGIHLY